MMAEEFDPDAYLATPPAKAEPEFDPDAYLRTPRERGVLERAGEAVTGALKSGARAVTERFTREEAKTPGEAFKRALPGGGAASALLSPLAAAGAGVESLVASGLAGAKRLFPGATKTSEQLYEESLPEAGQLLSAVGAGRVKAPGFVGPTRFAAEPEYAAARKIAVPAKGEEAAAGRALEEAATDPEAVRKALATAPREIVPGSKPTTFQLTQDPGLGQLERASARGTEAEQFKTIEQAQNAARQRALEGIQTAGSPGEVADHIRNALAAEESGAERATQLAQQRAWEAAQRPGGTYDPTTYGNVFQREIRIAEDRAKANESQLWRAVDPDGRLTVNPQPLQEMERGVYGNLTEAGAASITPVEKQISDLIQGYRPVTSFREMTDLRSLTSTALREELYTRGQTPAYGRLSRLRQGIEDAVTSAFDEAGTSQAGAAERLRAASAATRERAETFRPLRDVTRREGAEGPYRMGPSAVPGRIIQSGPKGYDSVSAYLRAVGNERGLPELQDAVAASMRQKAIGADGVVDPKKLDTWMRQNEGALRAISERDGGAFVQTLRDAGQAQAVVEQAQARQAAISAQRGSAALKGVLGATDDSQVIRVVGDIFGRAGARADAPARMAELVGRVRGNPDALAGLRRAVIEHIRETFTSNAPAGLEANMLRAEQFQNFLKGTRLAALREVLEPEQVQTLQNVAADIRRMNTSVATKIRGGSDTAQNIAQMNMKVELAMAAGEFAIEHAATGFLMPPLVSATRLGLKGLKALRAGRQAARVARIEQIVDRAMADPDLAQQLLSRAWRTQQRGAAVPLAIGAGNVGQAAQPAPRQTGGGVPAIGGTGGRSPGAREIAYARAPRQGPSQALQDGGEARAQAGPAIKPGTREHWAALIMGSPGAGGISSSGLARGKPAAGVSRNDIVEMLRRRGLSGEALGSFKDYSPESYQEGGEVGDEKLPLPGQSRGLRSTAGPTVTSTTREADIPPPVTRGGETFPTYVLRHWAQGFGTLPERATRAAGELQRTGTEYDPGPILEAASLPMGGTSFGAPAGALGAGAVVRRVPRSGGEWPGIYKDPRAIVQEASGKLAPEHPAMKELFGVTRQDLYDIAQQGRRPGNLPDPAWITPPPGARGAAAAEAVMNPQNAQRILDVMEEAGKHPQLIHGMDAWYVMDPAYQRLEQLYGPQLARRFYDRLNTLGAMASPASDVMNELRRGSAANMMAHQERFPEWMKWAGVAETDRPMFGRQPITSAEQIPAGRPEYLSSLIGQRFPTELADVPGHLAHRTAHGVPMENYLRSGAVEMTRPKVAVYIPASGVPQTGFQTRWMVPDAHISKSLGMADVRTPGTLGQSASMSMPEYRQVGPWYRQYIAEPLGVEAVPAQARQWSVFAPQTGVRTLIGAPKLELMSQRIWERAKQRGWDPRVLRDYVLSGGAHMRAGGAIQ